MSLQSTLKFIWNHPLASRRRGRALADFARWQIGSRLLSGTAIAVPFVNEARLLARTGMVGATGNLYVGLHEFEDMAFLLHLLRSEDIFVDVGANVGSYSVLAGGVVGARGLAFEPVPATFAHLCDNLRLNGIDGRVRAEMCCVGRVSGRIRFTTGEDATNHVVSEAEGSRGDTVDVPVRALDELTESPTMLKVDVEGFESEVLAGATRTLEQKSLIAVLLELNGSATRYGYDESAIHDRMIGAGFLVYRYDPFQRELTASEGPNASGNTLYLRDLERVRERVSSAPRFIVKGMSI